MPHSGSRQSGIIDHAASLRDAPGPAAIGLVANCIDAVPPLAWIAVWPKGGSAISLLHGQGVDLFGNGFFEGAWDAPFADAGFDAAVNVFGSGGKVGSGRATFVGPSHTLEPLYIARTDRLSAVSNSLPFLLYHCDLKLDLHNFGYGAIFSDIVYGLEHTPRHIELKGGVLTLLYHHNAVLAPDGTLTVAPKALPPGFPGYADYVSYLTGVTARVFRNADDPARRCRYRPIATISSGYDSAATAVIAKSCGCGESVGLSSSNQGASDSGRPVAEALGLPHTEFARMQRAPGDDLLEAEFLATGMQGGDLVFSVFEEKLGGRVLVTGFHGDKAWGKSVPPTPYIKRGDISGTSFGEFRLRRDFLHFPLAFVGARRHFDIHRISNAPDMAAYSVGGTYDRPVPRRVLEDAGVPRSLFGRAKSGATIFLFQGREYRMSRQARASIAAYLKREGAYPWYSIRIFPRILWWTAGRSLHAALSRFVEPLFQGDRREALAAARARVCARLFNVSLPVFGATHPRFTMLLMWSLSRVQDRYAAAGRHPSASSSDPPAKARPPVTPRRTGQSAS